MNANNKLSTFIGFAVKSRNIVFGVDDILSSKKAKLILVSSNLSENSRKKLSEYAENKHISMVMVEEDIFETIFKDKNIKAIAITDENLANAIKNQ